jgi:hypothetical protein
VDKKKREAERKELIRKEYILDIGPIKHWLNKEN